MRSSNGCVRDRSGFFCSHRCVVVVEATYRGGATETASCNLWKKTVWKQQGCVSYTSRSDLFRWVADSYTRGVLRTPTLHPQSRNIRTCRCRHLLNICQPEWIHTPMCIFFGVLCPQSCGDKRETAMFSAVGPLRRRQIELLCPSSRLP